jgi:hypothetical protein
LALWFRGGVWRSSGIEGEVATEEKDTNPKLDLDDVRGVAQAIERWAVWQMVMRLPAQRKVRQGSALTRILELRQEGLDHRAIAKALSITPEAVHMALMRHERHQQSLREAIEKI